VAALLDGKEVPRAGKHSKRSKLLLVVFVAWNGDGQEFGLRVEDRQGAFMRPYIVIAPATNAVEIRFKCFAATLEVRMDNPD
jgi:hypothetical protein